MNERSRVVIFGSIGVMVVALTGYIVTPSPPRPLDEETIRKSKEEFLRSRPPQAVYK